MRNPDQSSDKPVDYPEGTYREEDAARQYFAIRNYYDDRDDTALYLDFCGTQNPSTSATFGQYSPMANGTPWRYPFEYPGKGDGEAKNGKAQIIAKRKRGNAMYFSLKSAMTYIERGKFRMELGGSGTAAGIYASVASNEPDAPDKNHWSTNPPRVYQRSVYPEDSDPAKDAGGFDAALSAADENREYIDAAIAVGDTFLLGDQIITCTSVSSGELWESNNRFVKNFYFEIDDTYSKYSIISEDDRKKRIDTDNKGPKNINEMYRTDYVYPLQRVSIGAASTTRRIDAVEIGIKSTVWRKINSYPNVNQFKGTTSVNEMAKAGYSLTPGQIDRYTSRISFSALNIGVRRVRTTTGSTFLQAYRLPLRGTTHKGSTTRSRSTTPVEGSMSIASFLSAATAFPTVSIQMFTGRKSTC